MELWREIVDSLGDAVMVISPTFEPIAANAASEMLLGVSQVNSGVFERLIRHNQWLARMLDSCLRTGQHLDNPEAALLLDRREIAVRAEVSPLHDSAGHREGAIVLLHDLSHQKGAENAFDSDQNGLRLSPAGLAHEVKNPLTGIKGAAELLATMFPSDTRAQQYCGLILDGVNRIASLVEQVLAVSGPQRLKHEPVNIHQVLHQALRMAAIYPEPPHGLIVLQNFDPSLPEVYGDAAALERVFLNLFRNALDAIAAAPTAELQTIRLRTAIEGQFRLSAHGRRRQYLRVEISDSGKGMTAEEVKQLFTPFFTTKPAGTGLGLVLSRRVVALHGGKLWAEHGGVDPEAANGRSMVTVKAGTAPLASGTGIKAKAAEAMENVQIRGMTFCVILPIGPE